MATLHIVELDAHGSVLGTQDVPITTSWPVQPGDSTIQTLGMTPSPGGQQSAPFHPNTAMLQLTLSQGTQQAVISFGADPRPLISGIVITGPILVPPGGAKLAVL